MTKELRAVSFAPAVTRVHTEIAFSLIQALSHQPRDAILAATYVPQIARDLAIALQKRRRAGAH